MTATPSADASSSPARSERRPSQQRLLCLDAYRGLIMVTLAFSGFGLAGTSENFAAISSHSVWPWIHFHSTHVDWIGCGYWDMIQPSFMFMVGVAMAYSYAKRASLGQSSKQMLGHAIWRGFVLTMLGVFLSSNWGRPGTNWSFVNVLSQIGLGYPFLFLLWNRTVRTQAIAAAAILLATWIAFVAYPSAGLTFEEGAVDLGVTPQWAAEHLDGVGAAWHKNANFGAAFDRFFLNLFSRAEPFVFNAGGYNTLNFVPSLATMIFGLMCGELLRRTTDPARTLRTLLIAGLVGVIGGQIIGVTGICPIVKRIWSPSWAIYSTGWCCFMLAALYLLIDLVGWRRWTWPLVVVGSNSIAIYLMAQLLKPWVRKTLRTHLGEQVFELKLSFGETIIPLYPSSLSSTAAALEPTVQATLVGLVFWLACLWMYRQKIFLRV
ncbi:MAG: hypothetical protein QGG36_30025 [Pirellulaceae bacterium]|nr:hypothetical protein [Pirellulaceae bacterium]